MSFSKHPDSDAVCYTKPLDSLKHWNDHFFWVDSFASPASFSWHTGKNVSRDLFPKSTKFNADDYATLVAHPTSFWKFPEPFLCLIGMSRNYTLDEDTYPTFLHDDGTSGCLPTCIVQLVADPTKVKVRERECVEGEARLLDSTVRYVVSLLPVALAHAKSELEASVERLFDEGGNADQGDSAANSGQKAETRTITEVRIVADENVVAERPKRLRKKRQVVTDASGSLSPKKLRGTMELLVRLLPTANLLLSLEKHESCPATDSITGLNRRTLSLSKRFVISLDSSHHTSTNATEAGIDYLVRSVTPPLVMIEAVTTTNVAGIPSTPASATGTKVVTPVRALMFLDSDSTGTVKSAVAGSSHALGMEISMGSRDINSETLHDVFVLQWNVSNDTLLDDHDVSWEFIDHLAPPMLFAQIREMDYHHLFTEFNVGTARQACLNAEVRMRIEYCLSERRRLESECEKQADLLKVKDAEIKSLKAQLLLRKLRPRKPSISKNAALENEKGSLDEKVAELQSSVSTKDLEFKELSAALSFLWSQNDGLVDQVHKLEATCFGLRGQVSGYERLKEQIEKFQDAQMNIVNDIVANLDADLLEMDLYLEEKFYPNLLNTISGQRWLLTHGLRLAVVKCLNSQEYLSALGVSISRAIKKGMQDELSAGIDHGKASRSLEDVVTYNQSAKAEYASTIKRLREVDFPLLVELKSYKDTSIADVMDLLYLEDQVVLGETSLSFSLNVTHFHVERIRENVTAKRSALINVWTPLVDPFSVENLIGEADTFGNMPITASTTTSLSATFALASTILPITIEDYEIMGTDDPEDAEGSGQVEAASFPNTVEFEKEELDTSPERDPPS
uniref:Transposase (Putative), gypsy type n=1 Tax=Tanacetum cinerariifolium TaxID=118510 RepID=A0A699I2L3_TANCI|nr:transposase (putative), gypsy type [Tanacetum cinerariifolium]